MKIKKYSLIILGISILLLSTIATVHGYELNGTYKSTSGNDISFDTFEGKPLMIEAIQTTCSHCRDPDHRARMNQLRAEYSSDVYFLMLTVRDADTADDLRNFENEFGITWIMGFDENNILNTVFSVTGTPTSILLDSDGNLIQKWAGGAADIQIYADALNQLLGQDRQIEETFSPSGTSSSSIIENLFSNPLFQSLTVVSLLIFVYLKSVGGSSEVIKEKLNN